MHPQVKLVSLFVLFYMNFTCTFVLTILPNSVTKYFTTIGNNLILFILVFKFVTRLDILHLYIYFNYLFVY